MQKNGRISNADLADKVGLSTSACHRRLQRLFDEKTISRVVALISERAVQLNLTVFVEIKLSRQVDEVLEEFERAVTLIPEILECHLMAGSADYLLKVVVGDGEDFERIHRRYLSRLPNVSNIMSSFSLRKVYKTTALPI
ncbi:MAG: AsnC family transcriptional regulator [Rhodobacteraceae bacterium]|nr:MAG: AsnC family transcriptional regulator [Paracoccaceae bacterium]|tara:strand:+ start:2497 stop:2916 length:420 start_codon:yes stop_codon:yes gene_type:complete